MKKNIPVIITFLSVTAAISGISFGVRASNERAMLQKEAQDLRDQLKAQGVTSDREAAPVAALKKVSGIETNDGSSLLDELAARDAELERLQAELERRRNRGDRQSFQERMAQMREEDPERYEEMIKERTERQNQMRYDQANRLASLMDMDTSAMTEEELANHTLLLEKLSALWDTTGTIDPENPPNRETMREMFSSVREIGDMMEMERSYMFEQLGSEVGLTGSDAEDFSAYVESIIDATTLQMPRRGRGGGGGGR